jgi:predicted ribosomally synthesized peptide with nif11-like leader
VSLDQLDAFLAHARHDAALAERLHDAAEPPELEEFLRLAKAAGFAVEADDLIAAHQRAEAALSDQEIQRRAGQEARRLRTFIPG